MVTKFLNRILWIFLLYKFIQSLIINRSNGDGSFWKQDEPFMSVSACSFHEYAVEVKLIWFVTWICCIWKWWSNEKKSEISMKQSWWSHCCRFLSSVLEEFIRVDKASHHYDHNACNSISACKRDPITKRLIGNHLNKSNQISLGGFEEQLKKVKVW